MGAHATTQELIARANEQILRLQAKANSKALDTLEHYKNVRRMLPLMSDGNRMGNHNSFATRANGEYAPNRYNGHKSFYATQGIDVR